MGRVVNCFEMKRSNVFLFCACIALTLGSDVADSEEKRILLNDPTYVQQQLDHLQSQIQDLQVKLNQHATSTDNGRGISFVRWGRKDCSGNFSTVYTGYAGGSWYQHKGAAVHYLCMPYEPIWGPNEDKVLHNPSWVGYVYGAEYESPAVYGMADYNEDVPCAFCHSSYYSTQAMIPGRTACYPGWTEAYHGDLSSGHYNGHSASQYVCVDQHPEALDGGADVDNDGKLFNTVKTKCGSLRCPPYKEGKILSCVVCAK